MKKLILLLVLLPFTVEAFYLTPYVTRAKVQMNTTKIGGYDFVNSLNSKIIMPNATVVFDYFKNGGSSDMTVNGSVTVQSFRYTSPAGFSFLMKDVNFYIQGANNTIDRFGSIAGGLDNGITFKLFDSEGTLLNDFTGGEPIKKNGDFYLLASASPVITDAVAVNFNILTTGVAIPVPPGGHVEILVQDDLTSLAEFRVSINGVLMPGEIEFAD